MKRIFLIKIEKVPRKKEKELQEILDYLRHNTELVESVSDAEAVVVLGGDGTLLHAVRKYRNNELPFYGFNFGTVGFLLAGSTVKSLQEVLENKTRNTAVQMLCAKLYNAQGRLIGEEYAFNDFYFERANTQTAKIRVTVNGDVIFNPLFCDTIIVCSAAGSTAYNASARGIILPLASNSFVITASAPSPQHGWVTTQLGSDALVDLKAVEREKRPVRFLVDGIVVDNVARAVICPSEKSVILGFPHSWDYDKKRRRYQFKPHEGMQT